jgi:hypothetical protein
MITNRIKFMNSESLCILSCIRHSNFSSDVTAPGAINIIKDTWILVPVELGLELVSSQIPGSKYLLTIYDADSANSIYEVLVSVGSSVRPPGSVLVSMWLLNYSLDKVGGDSQLFSEMIIDLLCRYPIPTHLLDVRTKDYYGSVSIRIIDTDFTKYSQFSVKLDYVWDNLTYRRNPKYLPNRWWNSVSSREQWDSLKNSSESRYLLQVPRISNYPDKVKKLIWDYANQIIPNETDL